VQAQTKSEDEGESLPLHLVRTAGNHGGPPRTENFG
jgi:hypothetical protein